MNIKEQKEFYGKDAKEWLQRWDNNQIVWSIEMGGLGPGYEQAIQITVAEVLRHLINTNYNIENWNNGDKWNIDRDKIYNYGMSNDTIKELGLSGAQWGAAVQLACKFYMLSPVEIMNMPEVKDRHIQVKKKLF